MTEALASWCLSRAIGVLLLIIGGDVSLRLYNIIYYVILWLFVKVQLETSGVIYY